MVLENRLREIMRRGQSSPVERGSLNEKIERAERRYGQG